MSAFCFQIETWNLRNVWHLSDFHFTFKMYFLSNLDAKLSKDRKFWKQNNTFINIKVSNKLQRKDLNETEQRWDNKCIMICSGLMINAGDFALN